MSLFENDPPIAFHSNNSIDNPHGSFRTGAYQVLYGFKPAILLLVQQMQEMLSFTHVKQNISGWCLNFCTLKCYRRCDVRDFFDDAWNNFFPGYIELIIQTPDLPREVISR